MNFVIIFADQMHKYALGKINQDVITPHLDALCEEGILFNNGYSNNPICGPYRGTLLTGKYTSHNTVLYNGDPLPHHLTTLPEKLNTLGYETSFVGKWHLGGNGNDSIPHDLRGGFKHFIGYQCYNGFRDNVIFWDENNEAMHFNEHRTEVTTELALKKLRELHKTGKPFLHVIGYQAPHYPEQPLPEYADLYKDKVFSETPDYIEVDPYTPTYSPYSPRPFENCPDYQRYGNNMAEYKRLYNAMVTQVDNGVGCILEELNHLGIADDTVVIFTSDHGDMQGSHGLKNKCLPYEKSCGVPFIVKDPQGIQNIVSDEIVSGIDIYPSLLEYIGCPIDESLDGQSFAKYTRGESPVINDFIVAEFIGSNNSWRMIRDSQYKLCINLTDETPYLLFDMTQDPYEMNNLVNHPDYVTIQNDLLSKMQETIKVNPARIESH